MLIAALTLPLGDQVASSLVVVLGVLALPVTCWGAFRVLRLLAGPAAGRLRGLRVPVHVPGHPDPAVPRSGDGNIASTMAGEFPFSISFALLPLAMAVLWRVCEDGKGWRAAAARQHGLSHILTTIVLVLGATGLLLRRPLSAALTSFQRLALVLGVAFCLTAFWGLGILRVPCGPLRRTGWKSRPAAARRDHPYLLLTLVGLVVAMARGERRVLLYAWPGAVAAFLFVALTRIAPEAALWNARMLPFLYLFSLLVAAYGASVVAGWVAAWLSGAPGCHCGTPGWPWSSSWWWPR